MAAGASPSNGFTVVENFESFGANAFLTDHASWTTSDQWLNNGIVSDAYPSNGNAGFIGGLYGGPTPPLPVNLNRSISYDTTQNLVTLRWVQTLANPNPDDSIRDTFGWAVKDTLNRTLASIKFENGNFQSNDGTQSFDTQVNVYRGGWSGENLTGSNPQQAVGLINRGGPTVFEIAINTTGHYFSLGYAATGGSYDTTGSYNFINLVESAPVSYSGDFEVGALTALWNLENTTSTGTGYLENGDPVTLYTGAGGNIMYFDNIAVNATTAAAIPEPSSLALLGIGSVVLLGLRKSRKA
jgi:hypothetical protein